MKRPHVSHEAHLDTSEQETLCYSTDRQDCARKNELCVAATLTDRTTNTELDAKKHTSANKEPCLTSPPPHDASDAMGDDDALKLVREIFFTWWGNICSPVKNYFCIPMLYHCMVVFGSILQGQSGHRPTGDFSDILNEAHISKCNFNTVKFDWLVKKVERFSCWGDPFICFNCYGSHEELHGLIYNKKISIFSTTSWLHRTYIYLFLLLWVP